MASIQEKFLTNTDSTGRFIVTSTRTGRQYWVEPILGEHTPDWGDLDPATKKITGKYGEKYIGAIKANESLITYENGFSKIHNLEPGNSPLFFIDQLDSSYPDAN